MDPLQNVLPKTLYGTYLSISKYIRENLKRLLKHVLVPSVSCYRQDRSTAIILSLQQILYLEYKSEE